MFEDYSTNMMVFSLFIGAPVAACAWYLCSTFLPKLLVPDIDDSMLSDVKEAKSSVEEFNTYAKLKNQILRDGIGSSEIGKLSQEDARHILRTKTSPEEKRQLKSLLLKWMLVMVENMSRTESANRGLEKLFERQHVDSDAAKNLVAGQMAVTQELTVAMGEAEQLEAGWGKASFQQAVQIWHTRRLQVARE